jgi:RNA polymerase sigma-70 factor (ECF subfamily)
MAAQGHVIHAAPIPVNLSSGFQELYQRYSETVYRAALRVTGNPADAEDALQTVFLRVLNQHERFEPSWAPAAYFRRAAVNAAIDIIRRRSTQAETPLEHAETRVATESPALLKQQLRQALSRLEPQEAEIFLLKYVEGLSTEELAEMYGIEKGTVGSRLFRIREALRGIIER